MTKMRAAQALLTLSLLAGCGGGDAASDSAAADSGATAAAAAATPATPNMAQYAGTWTMAATLPGTPQPVPSTMTVSPDGSTWTMSLEGRPNVPLTASMSGDSVVTESAEYESVLRKGVMVTVRTATIMSNNTMTGTMTATYKTPAGNEVVNGTITGTKNP